uniref:Uncharacterized protein n=1 Tax=Timema douglasi TaxID=61478 RepID=A0A7R8VAW4_TIMDO|nr:unnamed protein product [Timema douglasi]
MELKELVPEVLRVPGSPQREARRVRGSWRDYLDPAGACHVPTTDLEDYDDGEEEEEDAVVNSGDFEPFSDTCGECEGESDMEGLDLTLFEPAPPAPEEENPGDPCCPRCCMQCVREALMERPGMLPATLYVLTPFDITGESDLPSQAYLTGDSTVALGIDEFTRLSQNLSMSEEQPRARDHFWVAHWLPTSPSPGIGQAVHDYQESVFRGRVGHQGTSTYGRGVQHLVIHSDMSS